EPLEPAPRPARGIRARLPLPRPPDHGLIADSHHELAARSLLSAVARRLLPSHTRRFCLRLATPLRRCSERREPCYGRLRSARDRPHNRGGVDASNPVRPSRNAVTGPDRDRGGRPESAGGAPGTGPGLLEGV